MKSAQILSFYGIYFPAFGLNTEIYKGSLRIQSEYRKTRTRKTFPNSNTFDAVKSYTVLEWQSLLSSDWFQSCLIYFSGVFRTQSIIYDGDFLRK